MAKVSTKARSKMIKFKYLTNLVLSLSSIHCTNIFNSTGPEKY